MQFSVNVPDEKAAFSLIRKNHVGKFEELTKEQLKEEIRQAVREVELSRQGKMKGRPLDVFLRELDASQ